MNTKISLFILSGIRPLNSYKDAASFIESRYIELINAGIKTMQYMITNVYSERVKFFFKIIRHRQYAEEEILSYPQNKFQEISVNSGVVTQISRYLFPTYYLHKLSSAIEKIIIKNESNISILHAHVVYPYGYILMKLSKKYHIPCVITAHGSDIHTRPKNNNIIRRYTLHALNNSDKVIFVSHALLKSAMGLGYSGSNAIVIPNGINSHYFHPMPKEEAQIKTRWKQTNKYVVGFVGSLNLVKRADKFIEIFSRIRKKLTDVEFIVVGDGDLMEDIQSECKLRDIHVTFTGIVPHEEVGFWMNLFDVMIFPSRNEGWGCVIIEAYACGTSVVGSANGGIPEALGDLCPAVPEGFDFEARFAKAVCDVLTGKIVINRENLVSWALEHTWENSVEKEIEIYHQLLE